MAQSCSRSACLAYSAKGIPAGRPSSGWIQARALAIVFAISALGFLGHAQWTPPPGGGDNTVCWSEAMTEGNCPTDLVDAALDVLVEAGDPNAASIRCAWESQAVNVTVFIPVPLLRQAGAADSNTIAVSRDIVKRRDIERLAMLLAHEWHHVKQAGDSPETPGEGAWPAPCREYAALGAEYVVMCSLMASRRSASQGGDLVTKPFLCSDVEYIMGQISQSHDDCLKATVGSSLPLPSLPHCTTLWCDNSGK